MSIINKDVSDKSWLKREPQKVKNEKLFWKETGLKAVWKRMNAEAKVTVMLTLIWLALLLALSFSLIIFKSSYIGYVVDVISSTIALIVGIKIIWK